MYDVLKRLIVLLLVLGAALYFAFFYGAKSREAQDHPTTTSIIEEVKGKGFSDVGAGNGLNRGKDGRLIAFNVLARVGKSRPDSANPMQCMAVVAWREGKDYDLYKAGDDMLPAGPVLLHDPTNAKALKLPAFAGCDK